MASRKPKEPKVEEVIAPDFELARRFYFDDIKPAAAKGAEFAQKQSEAFKGIEKRAHVNRAAAKLAFSLDKMEESKRDDYLRSLRGMLTVLNIFMPTDMVDVAEGKGSLTDEVIPTGQRRRPQLATIQGGKGAAPAGDTDLADGDDSPSVVDQAKADAAPYADGKIKSAKGTGQKAVATEGDAVEGDGTGAALPEVADDTFGIVNERTGEWLGDTPPEADDLWLPSFHGALKVSHADATKIIGEFDSGDTLVARRVLG